jgi:hypothetical protein
VQTVTDLTDVGISKNNHRLFQIGGFALRFHINADKTETVVKEFLQRL